MKKSIITQIDSKKPGPVLAIFGGVHGNEAAGIMAIEELSKTLSIAKGRVYLVLANSSAIEANVRMVNKNLNRCFLADNKGGDPEDKIARRLMKLLDGCDALLDLHMFYDDGEPFAICEEPSVELATIFDVGIISTNWASVEPGATDGYMFSKGKIGVCLECGPIARAQEYKDFAKTAALQFLKYFDMTVGDIGFSTKPKKIIEAKRTVYKSSADFKVAAGLHNFDQLKKGQVLAEENDKKILAKENECIMFPHYDGRVGEEAYIIGNQKNSRSTKGAGI